MRWVWLAVFLACVGLMAWHPWSAAFAIGVHPYPAGTPWTYQLWSGFIPSLAIVSIIGGIASHFRMINCHVHGCWRMGRFELAGGQFKVCHKHSPHPDKLTHWYILNKHKEHLKCAAPPSSSS
jgi:hypothetical protein